MITWVPMHKRSIIKKIFAISLALVLLTSLAGCEEAPIQDEKVNYSITLVSQDGNPLEGVKIFVYEDPLQAELVSVGTTDAEGKISFVEEPQEAFVAILKDVPLGFTVEEMYTVSLGDNKITLLKRALTNEELSEAHFRLGDQFPELLMTDCDGNIHSVTELLKQKKAVVLNFWYLHCDPCRMEFPYLQEAYDAYGDEVAFLALNPVDGTDETVRNYRWEQGLTFPMACADTVLQNAFRITAYPTTLIIDRSGTICLSHVGMFTDSDALCNALEYFTQETYEQHLFETIEEIPAV